MSVYLQIFQVIVLNSDASKGALPYTKPQQKVSINKEKLKRKKEELV